MIIRKISLANIRSCYGNNTLELPSPSSDKCIHLLGAYNGSGKTTLFEAINACLFASEKVRILRATDLSRGVNSNEMSVEIEFEHNSCLYRLNRRWTRNPRRRESSTRSVTLQSFLRDMDSDYSTREEGEIADFIEGIIPYAIRHFFLFDGERIQEYTDAAANNVKDALERLLGLSPYIQLLKDMSGGIDRDLRDARDNCDVKEDLYEKLEAQSIAEAKRKSAIQRIAQTRRSADEIRRDLTTLERQQAQYSLIFDEKTQAKRRELEERRDVIQSDIENSEEEIKQLISTELPIVLFWPEIQQAYNELPESSGPFEIEDIVTLLWEHRKDIAPALNRESPETLRIELMSAAGAKPETTFYSSVSEGLEKLAGMIEISKGKLLDTPARLERLHAEFNQIKHELDSLPSQGSFDMDISTLNRDINEKSMLLAQHESALTSLTNEQKDLDEELKTLNVHILELSAHDREFNRLNSQLNLCAKIQDILERFITEYRHTRIRDLEEAFNRKFKELTNNPMAWKEVEINRDTFDINVISSSDTDLSALEQSAGQKEILAFALIASIIELSDKQLPVLIDTPLARLDTIHRDNILTKFFPYVGQQVIVLATDAEVGLDQYRRLSPHLASEHHLEIDTDMGRTAIKEGYIVQ